MDERPYVPYCATEKEYEEHFERLLAKYPPPKNFNITIEDDEDDEQGSKRQEQRPVRIL